MAVQETQQLLISCLRSLPILLSLYLTRAIVGLSYLASTRCSRFQPIKKNCVHILVACRSGLGEQNAGCYPSTTLFQSVPGTRRQPGGRYLGTHPLLYEENRDYIPAMAQHAHFHSDRCRLARAS